MRIVCDKCQTTYLVPEDKIVKNVLRLDCQRCGNAIITRVEQGYAEPEKSPLQQWRNTPKRPSAATNELPQWYYSENGESIGPFTKDDFLDLFKTQKIHPDIFIWHNSLPEWLPAREVEPFSTIFMKPPPPPKTEAPVFTSSDRSKLPPLIAPSTQAPKVEPPKNLSSPDLKSLKSRLQETPSVQFNALSKPAPGMMGDPSRKSSSLSDFLGSLPTAESPKVSAGPRQSSTIPDSFDSLLDLDADISADFPVVVEETPGKEQEDPISLPDIDISASNPNLQTSAEEPNLDMIDISEITGDFKEKDVQLILDPSHASSSEAIPKVTLADNLSTGPSPSEKGKGDAGESESQKSYEDIFAKVNELKALEIEEDTGVTENTMMLQIEHLQRSQTKHHRRLILLSVTVLLVIVIGGFILLLYNQEEADSVKQLSPQMSTGLNSIEGRFIQEEELAMVAPEEEFEILPAEHEEEGSRAKEERPRTSEKVREKVKTTAQDLEEEKEKMAQVDSALQARAGQTSLGRTGSSIQLKETGFLDEKVESKAGRIPGVGSAATPTERMPFTSGLRIVSRTVQECHKRELKMGPMDVDKVYIRLSVLPSGQVDSFSVEGTATPVSFENCLKAKMDRWKFEPYEGEKVELRQGFVL